MKRIIFVALVLMTLVVLTPNYVHGQSLGRGQPLLRGQAAPCPQPGVPVCSAFWSGYVYGMTTPAPPLATTVSGDWTIPAALITPPPGYTNGTMRIWIGLGGALSEDPAFLQIGTEATVNAGVTHYFAFYDVQPSPPVTITSMSIHPGDELAALIFQTTPCAPPARLCWLMKLVNSSRFQTFQTPVITNTVAQASAQWIVEAPEMAINNDGEEPASPFPQSDVIAWDNMQVNGQIPVSTTIGTITMIDPRGQTSNPSPLDSNGDGFSTCWGNGTTLTPCAPPGT